MWRSKKDDIAKQRAFVYQAKCQKNASIALLKKLYGRKGMNVEELAFKASKQFRKETKVKQSNAENEKVEDDDAVALTYGEIDIVSFQSLLDIALCNPAWSRQKFVDLGCGTGKPVLTAALGGFGFNECTGIEIVQPLWEIAQQVSETLLAEIEKYNKRKDAALGDKKNSPPSRHLSRTKKSKSKKKTVEPLSEEIFCTRIKNLVAKANDDGLELEALSTCLIKAIGRRQYKESLKGHRTLKRFIQKACKNELEINMSEDQMCFIKVKVQCGDAQAGDQEEEMQTCHEDSLQHQVVEEEKNNHIDCLQQPPDVKVEESQKGHDDNLQEINKEEGSYQTFEDEIQECLEDAQISIMPAINLILGDIFEVDWSDADVIYIASLLFTDSMMQQLSEKVELLKSGVRIITLKKIESARLRVIHEGYFKMSWQMAYVFVMITA